MYKSGQNPDNNLLVPLTVNFQEEVHSVQHVTNYVL